MPLLSKLAGGALAAVIFTSLASAQLPGLYVLRGTACGTGGTGGTQVCAAQNDPPPGFTARSLPNTYAFLVVNGPTPITVSGFEVYTESGDGATHAAPAGLWLAAGSVPATSPAASGTITVGAALGWYTVQLNTTVSIPANANFYVGHYTGSNNVRPPDAGTSGVSAGTSYYRSGSSLTGSWTPSVTIVAPIYRVLCGAGGTMPTLSATGMPMINQQFTINLNGAPPSMPVVLIFGLSSTSYLGVPLPIDLTPIGATGCRAYVSIDWQGGFMSTATGTSTFPTPIPNVPSLVGAQFHNQWIAVATGANPLNLLTSNYGTATIGG